MKSKHLLAFAGLGLALVAGFASIRSASAGDDDIASVRQLCSAFVDAFNAHDAKGMAAGFADDADALGPQGNLIQTRAAIEAQFASEHGSAGPLREATLEVKEEPVRFIVPEVAISDAKVVVTGAYGPDGKKAGPMSLHVTNIWKKTGGEWRLAASRPFPVSPAPKQAGAGR